MLSAPSRSTLARRIAVIAAGMLLSTTFPLASYGQAPAQAPALLTATEAAAWREDLRALATELPRRHPMLFEGLTPTKLTRSRLDSAVRDLDARIPSLTRSRTIVELARLVAMVGAGHTSLNPLYDRAAGFRYYPLILHAFRDGIFIRAAGAPHAALVGARVTRIGRLGADSALRLVGSVVSHENEQFVRAHAVTYMMLPEVLDALGIAPDAERLPIEVERDGRRWTATIAPAGRLEINGHEGSDPNQHAGWTDMRASTTPAPLYLSRHEPRWLEYLPERRTLYVAYQSSVPPRDGGGEPINAFFDRVLAACDSQKVERLVLDVRDNMGGESFYNRQLLLGIIRRTQLDQRGKLFVVIGRRTYSAAQNLVNDMERYTNATFVGEPTGSPPAFFGDHRPLTLPNSGVAINISTLWWQTQNPRDRRLFVAPQIYAEESSADYRAGRDPAMDAILERIDRPPLAARLTEALARGDTSAAFDHLSAYIANPQNRFLGVEAEVNALGYEQLRQGRAERAVQLFTLNVRAFPRSANALDSLGEAYERLGRAREARAAYTRALALDPAMASARDGLRRVGQDAN
jgi:hypothetical protein